MNSPIYFRKSDDLAFAYTPGYDSGDDAATDGRGDVADADDRTHRAVVTGLIGNRLGQHDSHRQLDVDAVDAW